MFRRTTRSMPPATISPIPAIENLEPRLLMAADLSAGVAFAPGSFNDGLVAGDRGTVNLALTNVGSSVARGTIYSDLYLSTDDVLDDSDVLLAGNVRTAVNIKAGRTSNYKLAVTVPALNDGQYYVIADVNTTGSVPEASYDNNLVMTAGSKDVAFIFGLYHGRRLTQTMFDSTSGSDVTVLFSSTGRGYGVIAGDLVVGDPGFDIAMYGTDTGTNVFVTPDDGQFTQISRLDVHGSLNRLSAPDADLTGDLTISGTAAQITLGYAGLVGSGTNVTIFIDGDSRRWVNIDLLGVYNTSIVCDQSIGDLIVTEWIDDGGDRDTIAAATIDYLWVSGDSSGGVAGDFQAFVDVTTDRLHKDAYIGTVNINGTAFGATIRSEGDIDDIWVGAAVSSDFLAGVVDGVNQPDSPWDFRTSWYGTALGRIGSFTVTGLADDPDGTFFADSNVAAGSIGYVDLTNVAFDNGGSRLGLFAAYDNNWGEPIHSVVIRETLDGTAYALDRHDLPYTDGDFVIRIV